MDCAIRWCRKSTDDLVDANENIGDGCFRVSICRECAAKLGLKPGDDLPEYETVKRIIRSK